MTKFGAETTGIVKSGENRAFEEFSARLAPLGFLPAKKTIWARVSPHTVDFIHLHRCGSSYGRPINYQVALRIHFGICVRNSAKTHLHLNGPDSNNAFRRPISYHLRFNAQTWSLFDRCIDDMTSVVIDFGEPWFMRFRDPKSLLIGSDTPLSNDERLALQASLTTGLVAENDAVCQKLLGLRKRHFE